MCRLEASHTAAVLLPPPACTHVILLKSPIHPQKIPTHVYAKEPSISARDSYKYMCKRALYIRKRSLHVTPRALPRYCCHRRHAHMFIPQRAHIHYEEANAYMYINTTPKALFQKSSTVHVYYANSAKIPRVHQ